MNCNNCLRNMSNGGNCKGNLTNDNCLFTEKNENNFDYNKLFSGKFSKFIKRVDTSSQDNINS